MSVVLAVHISDGVLLWPWTYAGFVLAGLLAWWGARRIEDEEIPRIALLTAAFFVVTLLHIKAGPTSVHLLLNGLLGVMLGRRVCLAIPIGLLMQAVSGHGGFTSLGVNTCIFVVPALMASGGFALFQRAGGARGMNSLLLTLVGFLLGAGTALLTVLLNCVVLFYGGREEWAALVAFVLVTHVGVALVEGLVLGSLLSYLARVKPELIGCTAAPEKTLECAVDS